jgi:uncharacterized protein YjiS (DUF1127 family)
MANGMGGAAEPGIESFRSLESARPDAESRTVWRNIMALLERPQSGWSIASSYAPRAAAAEAIIGVGSEFARILGVWRERILQRREMARLDDRMLADIGMSRIEATREFNKPFWKD